jgi:hypothetical protein
MTTLHKIIIIKNYIMEKDLRKNQVWQKNINKEIVSQIVTTGNFEFAVNPGLCHEPKVRLTVLPMARRQTEGKNLGSQQK